MTCLPIAAACSAASYAADADREVGAILETATAEALGNRSEWVVPPRPAEPKPDERKPDEPKAGEPPPPKKEPEAGAAPPAQPAAAPAVPPAAAPPAPVPAPAPDRAAAPALAPEQETYDLPRSLAAAVTNNREYLSRRESLYRQGLSTSLARFNYGPLFNSTISWLWPDQEHAPGSQQAAADLGVSQILPTGGTLAITSSVSGSWPQGAGAADPLYGSAIAASLRQPLLAGAGYEVSHEGLTQSERELVYAVRDFELYREGFSISVARDFYGLQGLRKTLVNEEANYQSAVFDRSKAEALQRVGRNAEQEVFRARRRALDAEDTLINARTAYARAIDQFKILLGLPITTPLDVTDAEPPYESVRIEDNSAVAAALHNRLDLITERQRVEDTERALRLSENGLLPRLDLVANYGLAGSDTSPGAAGPHDWSSSIGVTFEVPLQRVAQRNSYRSAQISLEQARRDLALREDQLDLDIRDALRRLHSTEQRIELQKEQIVQEQGAVTVTQIRYEAGKLENRDLLEARQALIDAQNTLIRLKIDHFISRLELLRDMGVFFIDQWGLWR